MGVIFALIGFIIFAAIVGSVIGGIIWVYRRISGKNTTSTPLFPATALEFPHNFSWALFVLLIGFHVGLYTFFTSLGVLARTPAAGWFVFALSCSVLGWLLLFKHRTKFVYLTLLTTAASGFWMFTRANGFVQTWDFIFFLVSHALLIVLFVRDRLPISVTGWLGAGITLIPSSMIQGLRVLQSLFRKDANRSTQFFSWLKTAIIALILLSVFLGLLSQADPVFAEVVREFRSQLIGRAIWTILLIFMAAAVWTISFRKDEAETETEAGWLSYRDVTAGTAVVALVVGAFLIVQAKYLFGGSTDLLRQLNLTFSEYVRKGFTELLAAVFIGGLLAYLAGARARLWTGRERQTTQILNTALIIELGLLLVSALKRDLLYVDTYGITRVRIIGEIFLAWLAFFLVLLVLYSWHRIKEKMALTALWLAFVAVVVGINVINVDKIVANGAPGHHQYTDYFYLMQLSEDAAGQWPELLDDIAADIDTVVAKKSLTAEDRAQLAGLKLAVISFIENRDALFVKYAPDEWLLKNATQLGIVLPENKREEYGPYSWNSGIDVVGTAFPTTSIAESLRPPKNPVIPDSLRKYRSWQFTNTAEKEAYTLLIANQDWSFQLPKSLLEKILRYQLREQVSLMTEETRLLHELQYQFINVELRRYYPQSLNFLDLSNGDTSYLNPLTKDELTKVEATDPYSIAELSTLSCATVGTLPASFTVHGVTMSSSELQKQKSETAEAKSYLLRDFKTPTSGGIELSVPADVKPSLPSESDFQSSFPPTQMFSVSVSVIQEKPPSSLGRDLIGGFIAATVRPVTQTDATGCKVIFTASEVKEYYVF